MRIRWLGPERVVAGFCLQHRQVTDMAEADARNLIASGRAEAVADDEPLGVPADEPPAVVVGNIGRRFGGRMED